MQKNALREDISQRVAGLGMALPPMSTSESKALIREVFATLLLLHWTDLIEAEQEASALAEGRIYQPLIPPWLQWRQWFQQERREAIANKICDLADYVEGLSGDAAHHIAVHLHVLAEPIRRLLKVNFNYLIDLVRWIGDLEFETPSERGVLLDVFDQVMAETGDATDGPFSTPANIARLVAALADPQPGERVHDPCFGSGNFLLAAWERAGLNQPRLRASSALLEISGTEINSRAFLMGLTRILLAGIAGQSLRHGNSLEHVPLRKPIKQLFDVVLANPPIGIKTTREPWHYNEFAFLTNDSTGLFVQYALSQLRPHGRAVIAVPEGFLFRRGTERDLRRNLLEKGQVEAVVGLPVGAFAPYTSVRCCLIVLNRQGGTSRVRMVDANSMFEPRSGRKAPVISALQAVLLANEVRRTDLRTPRELVLSSEAITGADVIASSVWEISIDELAASDWDLSPRRREKGGLGNLLSSIKNALGGSSRVRPLSEVAKVLSGRSIKSSNLLDEPPFDRAVGYVRIKDLAHGKVGRVSKWLHPEIVVGEQRWTLLPGDVLVSKSGTIGKAALVRSGTVGSVAANGLYVLRANTDYLDPGFLLAYLASPACQNWLAAQSRGSVIQHLNRRVLDELPVPVPPLTMQARAAAQYRDFGTDCIVFLAQAMGSSESDRLTVWLAGLDSKVPKFALGVDDSPALGQFEPIVAHVNTAQRWLDQELINNQNASWLAPLIQALSPLAGVALIPAGPGLFYVLQEAERDAVAVLKQATGHLPAESQARAIIERLRDWLRDAVANLSDTLGLQVRGAPVSLLAGSFAEFSVELVNPGTLPLRGVLVETRPNWGRGECSYLAEQDCFMVQLRGDVPKSGEGLSLHFFWKGRNLMGQTVEGDIELAIRVAKTIQGVDKLVPELGGSPYVTGSPLEPLFGHSVFYGRGELIDKISRQIATHGNVVLLEGNRRTGKTSILKHLEGRTAIPGWLAVYSSLQGAEGASMVVGVPTAEVFREIARSIATALTKLGIQVPLPNGQMIAVGKPALGVARACRDGIGTESPFADFRDYLELVLSILEPFNLGLVLMLDEFDKLQEGIDSGVTSPQVPENIRSLIQSYPKFSAILTGSRRLKRLREEYWSALYGLGTSIPVTVLDVDSARKVVIEPVRDQLTFSQAAIDRVIDVTARHPYLMQCLCNRVFDFAVQTKSRSITESVVTDAAQRLVRDNEHFASLWDYAGRGPEIGRYRRQLIMLLCARSLKQKTLIGFGTLQEQLLQGGVDVTEEALDVDLTYLRELELVEFFGETGDGVYQLAIPLMADWIEQQQDGDVVASRARAEAEEENA
ncbi:N-6 DNA methylase [Aeromonas media]|uniref:N-6 DNA methylase n=1 Tax=Aeromonas media TaxID=651 RepID=UPI001F23FB0E|nr:N-6 DNA methylase [Aeromonas media]MCE9923906.1 N-6 DNA methylase [Aeromonas media]